MSIVAARRSVSFLVCSWCVGWAVASEKLWLDLCRQSPLRGISVDVPDTPGKVAESDCGREFAFALAVTAPVMIFANQGLTGLQATDARDEFSFADYFVCRLLTIYTAFTLIFFLSRIMHWSQVVVVVGAAKAAEALCDIKYGQYQRLDRMDRTAKSMVLRGFCSLLIGGILLRLFHSVLAATSDC